LDTRNEHPASHAVTEMNFGLRSAGSGRLDTRNEHRASHAVTEMMVFEYIIRHSLRKRASPCIAEGFSPTASAGERI
jgi:hypothetical protein